MQTQSLLNCKIHPGLKVRKFCMNNQCWTKICPKCAIESHKCHNVIELKNLTEKAEIAKQNLIQSKHNGILSLKQITNEMNEFKIKLKEATTEKKIEIKNFETIIIAKIRELEKEIEDEENELNMRISDFQNKLIFACNSQAKEISKVTELAGAVISKGTLEDLKLFFEICHTGMGPDIETVTYKKSSAKLKENLEGYLMLKPYEIILIKLCDESKNTNKSLMNLSHNIPKKNSLKPDKCKYNVKNTSPISVNTISRDGMQKNFKSSSLSFGKKTSNEKNIKSKMVKNKDKLNLSFNNSNSASSSMSRLPKISPQTAKIFIESHLLNDLSSKKPTKLNRSLSAKNSEFLDKKSIIAHKETKKLSDLKKDINDLKTTCKTLKEIANKKPNLSFDIELIIKKVTNLFKKDKIYIKKSECIELMSKFVGDLCEIIGRHHNKGIEALGIIYK